MLRALMAPSRGLLPSFNRFWAPVAHVLSSPRQVWQRRLNSSSAPPSECVPTQSPELTRLAEPGGAGIRKESPHSDSAEAGPSFQDVLQQMMAGEAPQTSDLWSRPAPPPHSDTENLVFFQTEIRQGPNAGQLSMFGVTEAGNSVCVHLAEYTSSSPGPSIRQFTLDTKIPSMAWISIPATKYRHISDPEKTSYCQLEVAVRCADVELHPEKATPPLRVLSFDVECLPRPDVFPEPATDPVIQISNMVSISGSTAPPFVRNIFTLGTCSPITGAAVLSYNEEADLLRSWSDFVRQVDPDLVIGFNSTGFDLPYLLARAKVLQISGFTFLGRLKGVESAHVQTLKYTTVRGDVRTWEDIPLAGRLQLDLMHYARCERGLKYLSLKSVSKLFLGEKKGDVHFTEIAGLQTGSADTRRQLAVYCLKDAYLPQRLLEVLGCVDRYTAVSHMTQTPFNSIVVDHDLRPPTTN